MRSKLEAAGADLLLDDAVEQLLRPGLQI